MGTIKGRVGGVWVPGGNIVVERVGVIERVVDQIAAVSLVTDTTAASATETTAAAASVTINTATSGLTIPFVASTSGVIVSSTSFTITRPTGTLSGDKLFLGFKAANSEAVAPTIVGWSLLSGLDTGVSSEKYALYSRTADLTATDTPTVVLTVSQISSGWMVAGFRSTTTTSAITKATSSSTTFTTVGTTVSAAPALAVSIVLENAAGAFVANSGNGYNSVLQPGTNTQAFNAAVATKWMTANGAAGGTTSGTSAGNSFISYGFNLSA